MEQAELERRVIGLERKVEALISALNLVMESSLPPDFIEKLDKLANNGEL